MSDSGQSNEIREIGQELIRLSEQLDAQPRGVEADAEARGIPRIFCLLWPTVRKLLERLKASAPDIIKRLIDQLIAEGNKACS